MADSPIVQIHKKIVELIAVDYATGYSTVNLTGNVIRGLFSEPSIVPSACVHFQDVAEEYGPTFGRFSGNIIYEIFCFIGGANPQERSDNSLNLASDIIKALTANRQLGLGSLVDDIKCDYSSVDGDKFGFNGIGIGYIRATVKFQSDTGV